MNLGWYAIVYVLCTAFYVTALDILYINKNILNAVNTKHFEAWIEFDLAKQKIG